MSCVCLVRCLSCALSSPLSQIKNLFIGVIVDGYSSMYSQMTSGGVKMSTLQKRWLDVYRMMVENPPPLTSARPNRRWFCRADLRARKKVFDTLHSTRFEYLSLGVIVINLAVLSAHYDGESDAWDQALVTINAVCAWWFVVETLLAWFALGIRQYFASTYNRFDFLVVCASLLDFLVDYRIIAITIGFNPSFLRVVRMVRIHKLLRRYQGIVRLGRTLV